MAYELILRIEVRPRTLLRLLDFLTEGVEDLAPLCTWLQPHGCCNGPTWVATEFNSLDFLFLERGWKYFALSQGLQDGHVLHFKFDGAAILFVKAFGSAGARLDFYMESNSSGNIALPATMTAISVPPQTRVGERVILMAPWMLTSRRSGLLLR
ncbi:hypothetical protein D1007_26064 [Hordeum vulgare]|nr:hypothetical protein D1007_26064 [Hordeum vulgare]